MKQRVYNTLIRKVKIKWIAELATIVIYLLTMFGYYFIRIFKNAKKNRRDINEEIETARIEVNKQNPKPDMICEAINQTIEENLDLSIIIPAYNVKDYIEHCIESIINQETKYNYEVIIVNDGSTDNTEEIIKQYKNEKIKCISQKNQGLSGARNTGINNARGKYITFVDSDDFLLNGAIEKMLSQITEKDADIVVGSHYMFVDGTENKEECILESELIENDTEKMVNKPGYAWGKIFKRELFNQIRFPVGAWYEDALVCSIIYRLCTKMIILDQMVYAYRINPHGISQTARRSPKSIDHYWVMEDVLRQADSVGLPHDEVFYKIMIGQMSTFLYRRISLLSEDTKRNVFIMSCDYLEKIRPKDNIIRGNKIEKDLEKAFETGNYKLWKLASFVI